MAVLPNVYDQRQGPSPTRGMALVSPSAAGATGAALAGLGGQVAAVGFEIEDREATAAAKEADVIASEKIRALLYDPENGYANLSGNAAVARRGQIIEQIKGLKDQFANLSPLARKKLEDSLTGRIERALGTVDTHASGERRNWLNGASEARIESAFQDSLVNPGETEISLRTTEQEIRSLAVREGWSQDMLDLKLEQGRSRIYGGIAERIAAVDPEAAAAYLAENRDKMRGEDVLALETKLIPLAKEAKGRKLGAQASLAGVSDGYLGSIRSAESGGNDAAKNPLSTASGRYQFIESTWAEVAAKHPELGLTPEGIFDPAQQELAIRAFTADNAKALVAAGIEPTNANLYAAHFLGAGGAKAVLGQADTALMDDVVGPGVIAANGFLSGMTVADFRQWTARKAGGSDIGYSPSASGLDAIIGIEDPVVRDAALNEFNLRSAVADGKRKAALAEAGNAAFSVVDSGGSVDSLPVAQRQALGIEAMSALRSYERSVAAKTPVETDDATYAMLRRMQFENPAAFRDANILNYADKLSDADRKMFIDAQVKPRDAGSELAASTLMSVATNHLQAIGLQMGESASDEDKVKVATIQTQLLRWQDDFRAKEGRNPTGLEIDKQVGALVASVETSAGKAYGMYSAPAFEAVPLDNTGNVTADVTIAGRTFSQAEVQELIDTMRADGVVVSSDVIAGLLAQVAGGK